MADIDEDISIDNLVDIIMDILKKYYLSKIHIIKSTNGYNIFSLDKLPLKEIYNINKQYPSIDQKYNELQYNNRRFYTLRIAGDKHYFMPLSLERETPLFVQSNGHRMFFNSVFALGIPQTKYYDNSDYFRIIRFLNDKHGVEMNG
jgi:hypothetical protein